MPRYHADDPPTVSIEEGLMVFRDRNGLDLEVSTPLLAGRDIAVDIIKSLQEWKASQPQFEARIPERGERDH
jgi:hypothetical protein